MKFIDMDNWGRKEHYNFFKQLDYPHFNVCANVNITKFIKFIKENNYPFFISFLYATTKTANSIKEFKYRIRDNKVIEHENLTPSFTVMTNKKVFGFCAVEFIDDFKAFKESALIKIEKAKNIIQLEDESGRDDYLFITSLPWVSFTSITHPIQMNPTDSIPRISWGKYFEENNQIKIPLSIQVHHALLDGVHVGEYFRIIENLMDNPQNYL